MPFQPGQSGNPAGRPAGSKNRQWADIGYWFKYIQDNIDALPADEKIRIAKWAMEILIGKIKDIETPADSAENAKATLELLKTLENKPVK